MEEIYSILKQCPLFQGIDEGDLFKLLNCLRVQTHTFAKGTPILQQDEPAGAFGLLIRGEAQIVHIDSYGAHSVIAHVRPRELFAEALALSGKERLPLGVYALSDCQVLMFNCRRVIAACPSPCKAHGQLLLALLKEVAAKNLQLTQKLEIVMQRTTEAKIMAYLFTCQHLQKASRFTIPFDRQGLADYLGVERTALSAVLSRLQKAGRIRYHKNEFELL